MLLQMAQSSCTNNMIRIVRKTIIVVTKDLTGMIFDDSFEIRVCSYDNTLLLC